MRQKLSPFEISHQKALTENAHLPVLFTNVTTDEWRKLSMSGKVPVGGKWLRGVVYGPPHPKRVTE